MILLVSAVREELGELSGEPLGVGAVGVAVRMAALLHERQPAGVLMLGTGGSFPAGPTVGSAVAATRVGWANGLSVMGLGYTPRPPGPVHCDNRLLQRISLPKVGVLTVGAITTDSVLAGRLADDWQVEQLEAFGVAAACAAANVPFAMVVGITHEVGPSAHAQWLTNREAARVAARDAVSVLFERGG